jgi:hypothetical protein
MAWVITKDHISEPDCKSAVGVRSRKEIAPDEPTVPFKLYDDDGELYYEGLITTKALNGNESLAFAPLWNFGMPNAGCTTMRYLDERTGEFVQL